MLFAGGGKNRIKVTELMVVGDTGCTVKLSTRTPTMLRGASAPVTVEPIVFFEPRLPRRRQGQGAGRRGRSWARC